MEVKTLMMVFLNADGGKTTISVDEPKFNISESEIKTAMDEIITEDVLVGKMSAKLIEKHSAQIVTRTIEEIEVE